MKNIQKDENRSLVENLPEWKRQWAKEAASMLHREYFFAVTKPKWKEIDRKMNEVQEQTAKKAGFRDYEDVRKHLKWTRFGKPETEELEARIKRVEDSLAPHIAELSKQQTAVAECQEEKEYQCIADKARLLERYIRYAVQNVRQIMANGRLLIECDIEGVKNGLMALIPEGLEDAFKSDDCRQQVAAQLFAGELMKLDKHQTLVLENGQVVDGFINNYMGTEKYDYQYEMAVMDGQRVILNRTPDEYDHVLVFFTNTPIPFNGENSMRVEYMRPSVELERSRMSEIQLSTSGTPYIRCKIDDMQQVTVQMDASDKRLYDNAKRMWGIRSAAELTKFFVEKYYAYNLKQEADNPITE